ncbi:MAG: sodium:proton antiporter [Methylobacter sp.]|nr:sodium:proton antiporter [Methylobacter sp.]
METETIFILLFVVATAVAIAVQRLAVPYTVTLVCTGLVLGLLHVLEAPRLTKALLFGIFLPGLLFDAAFHIEFKQFQRNCLAIFSLALPGVVVAIALTALILPQVINMLHFLENFTWKYALVFGALISASDPIAVVAIFKNLGVPRRLAVLLEGESLLNDGTAIVFFTLSFTLVTGEAATADGLAFDFIRIAGFATLIGTGIGLVVSHVIKQVNDPMIEITLTTIAAYGSFLTAEHFHFSGVIATVSAGMICGNYGTVGMSPSTRIAVESFWEYIAFALNSIVFLLIGLEVHIYGLLDSWRTILIAYLVVTAGRAMVIFGVSFLLQKTLEQIPWAWSVILIWGGIRGALSMVLVLSLPEDFAYREVLVSMTFGVVILSILIHGLTMSGMLRWLGISQDCRERTSYELTRGKLLSAHAALEEINQMTRSHFAHPEVLATLRQQYEQKIERDSTALAELHLEEQQLKAEELQWAQRHLQAVEKNAVIGAFHRGLLTQDVQEKLLADIDARLLRLESTETKGSTHHTDGHNSEK